ncbi:MAG: LCP family protein [Candidatus Limnocylindrales bacterium]|jgi:LCP family protein required for cell wall assembly
MRPKSWLQSPTGAALLSFLFPGLGQAAAGDPERGVIVAVPMIATLGAGAIVFVFDRKAIFDALIQPSALMTLLLLDGVVLAYRIWAIIDAYLLARGEQRRQRSPRRPSGSTAAVPLAILLIATVGTHAAFGAVDVQAQTAISCVFNSDAPCFFAGGGDLAPGETVPIYTDAPTDTPFGSAAGSAASATPVPKVPVYAVPTLEAITGGNTDWASDGKLVLLLVGADQGVGRWSLRPDTMILLEVDIATGRAAMYGIPRNLENVPLGAAAANAYPCHCFPYPNLLNALWLDAVSKPGLYPYPGSDFVRGFKALEDAVGTLAGLHVDGAVVLNLMGFVRLIDALFPQGLTVNVPTELKDNQYSEPQDGKDITIDIKPGVQQMDGLVALEYARSRHQDSDYGRMVRQQLVLKAIRAQINPCSLVTQIPSILGAVGQTFWTDMSLNDAPEMLALMEHIGVSNLQGYELTPDVTGATDDFLTAASVAKIQSIVAHGLDGVPAGITGGGGGGGGGLSC